MSVNPEWTKYTNNWSGGSSSVFVKKKRIKQLAEAMLPGKRNTVKLCLICGGIKTGKRQQEFKQLKASTP